MRSSVTRLWSARLLIATLTFAPFTVFAQNTGSEAPDRSSDAAVYASLFGVSHAEAQRRLHLQVEIGRLEADLLAAGEDVFAGLWIEHKPEFSVDVRFTDLNRGHELLGQLAAGLAREIEIQVAEAEFSLRELEALQEAAILDARNAGIAIDADINIRTAQVELMTTNAAGLEAVLEPLRARHAGRIHVLAVASLAQPDQAQPLRGGRPLSTCTTGFNVRHSSTGQVGTTTAAHCGNSQVYLDTGQSLPFRAEKQSGNHDVQWHSRACNMTVSNEFDSGIGIRGVTGVVGRDQQAIGSIVCRTGKSTSYRCGRIKAKNVCPSYVQSCSSTFIRVEPIAGQPTPLSAPGDSGGPWFVENLAYGIHSGAYTTNPDSVYMAINYVSALGVSVLTYNAGSGSPPSAQVTCWGNHVGSPQIDCFASTGGGGVPPYSIQQWSYWGSAPSWGSSGNQAWAEYGWSGGGCPSGAGNYFSVQVVDSCGQTGWGGAEANCGDCDQGGPGGPPVICPIY